MGKYKIFVTTEDGELLNVISIDTAESNWNSSPTTNLLGEEIVEEIEIVEEKRRNHES